MSAELTYHIRYFVCKTCDRLLRLENNLFIMQKQMIKMDKVIKSVYIFQQMAACNAAHTGGWTIRIQFFRNGVGFGIKLIVII